MMSVARQLARGDTWIGLPSKTQQVIPQGSVNTPHLLKAIISYLGVHLGLLRQQESPVKVRRAVFEIKIITNTKRCANIIIDILLCQCKIILDIFLSFLIFSQVNELLLDLV